MITLRPRVDPAAGALTSRSASLAEIWAALNRTALWYAFILGPPAVVAYVIGLQTTGHWAFAVLIGVGIGVPVLAGWSLRTGRETIEPVLLLSSVGIAAGAVVASPVVRGILWTGLVVFAVAAGLVLPKSAIRRSLSIIIGLAATPLVWPLFGLASVGEAVATVAIVGAAMFFGILAVRLARRALEASEEQRISMFRNVPVGLFRTSVGGSFLDANPALLEILGYPDTEDPGRLSLADIYADPRDGLDLIARLERESGPQRFAVRMRKQDGDVIWVRGQAQAVMDAEGAIRFFEGAIEDITQRREAERASKRSEERFRMVFDSAPIALWEQDFSAVMRHLDQLRSRGVTDLRSHLRDHAAELRELIRGVEHIDVNPAGIELLGSATKQEALDRLRYTASQPAFATLYEHQLVDLWHGLDHGDRELRVNRPDGVDQYLHLHWAADTAGGEADAGRIVVAASNVTALKAAERGLAALVRSKDELVASVSHELRNPITTIMGMALELRDNTDRLTADERRDFIGMIADQSRELSNIVEDLLVAARVDQDRLVVRPETVDLTDEVPRITSSTATKVVPAVDMPKSTLALVDPLRLRQVVRNLLTNADRYGGATVRVELVERDDHVAIRVCDDGDGVAPHERDAIFEPYHRSPDSGLPGSIGLGLPVSRRLARLMGGDLTYEREGDFTVFELSLPKP